jgi:hypothetical protein
MSPIVRDALAKFPFSFSPVNYTWLDVSLYEPPTEANADLLKFTGQSRIIDIPIEDYPLPFENIATVNLLRPLEEEEDQNFSPVVATFDRKGSKIFYKLYLSNVQSGAAVEAVLDGDIKVSTVSFGREYAQLAMANKIAKQEMLDTHKEVLAYILRKILLLGLRPDPTVAAGRPYGDLARNIKRKRKGKSQFWEWKTVELKSVVTLPSAPLGGTHASPKPHERMGHWRQYKSGRKVFIKAHIVNRHKIGTEGFVFHDYVKH